MLSRIAILVLSALTFLGCKKNSPLTPEGSQPVSPTTTVVIGTTGGTLAATDFRLTIPPDAFGRAETLKVASETYDNFVGSRNVSGLFKLEGLPDDFTKPLELRIKCTRVPASGYFIAVGLEGGNAYNGSGTVIYLPLDAAADSGYLHATLAPNGTAAPGKISGGSGRAQDIVESALWLMGVDATERLESFGQHFELCYPMYLQQKMLPLVAALEDGFSYFEQQGFNTGAKEFTDLFPMFVWVRTAGSGVTHRLGTLAIIDNSGGGTRPRTGLILNETEFVGADDRQIKMMAAETFALLLCFARDPILTYTPLRSGLAFEGGRIWPYFSIASYFGESYASRAVGESCPLDFRSLQLQPLGGVGLPTTAEQPADHGLGFSALIKYLSTGSPSVVPNITNAVLTANHGVEAIFASVAQNERDWWPGFLGQYIAGNIYSVRSGDLLKDLSLPNAAGLFTIADKTDTLRVFSDSYYDLSAKLFRVNLEYPGIDTSAVIKFSVGPSSLNAQYVGVALFGLKDSTLTYWQYANTVTVPAVRDLTIAGYDIVAAVVNCLNASPYYGSRTIDLTVSVESKAQGSGEASGSLEAEIAGTGTDNYSGKEQSGPATWMGESGWRNGTFSHGEFAGSWSVSQPDPYGGTETDVGELTITLKGAAPPAEISAIYFRRTVQTAGGTEVWELTSSAACNIPAYWENGAYDYRMSGTDVTNHFSTVYNRYDSQDGFWRSFSSPVADARNRVEIKIVAGGQGTQSAALFHRRR